MSLKGYTSIFFVVLFIWALPVSAQLNLELLDNSPTPTPLPEGQEYILEIEQIDLSKQPENKPTLTTAQRKEFERNGYVIIRMDGLSSLTIEKTHLTYSPFKESDGQIQTTQVNVDEHSTGSGFQLLMNLRQSLSSGETIISPTYCDESSPCTVQRPSDWDMKVFGWGYSFDGEKYRPVPTETTAIETQGISDRSRPFMMSWKIAPDTNIDGIYSARVQLIALPY